MQCLDGGCVFPRRSSTPTPCFTIFYAHLITASILAAGIGGGQCLSMGAEETLYVSTFLLIIRIEDEYTDFSATLEMTDNFFA